ncbi:dihydroorotate dehydrogenase electron transfer subunit [Candidatus Bathyarchaeota archaeon]|nr:dihydroorotate dehydrogenase electron transfer subunit [Candidatus Bathyarchaeota archaeon]
MPRKAEKIRAVELTDVRSECREITSLWFGDAETRLAKPGQYLMAWVPGIDEVPMSISAIDIDGKSNIAVRSVGETTQALSTLAPGDRIGVRGPYGNGYTIQGENPLIVAGGSGAASLMPLVRAMSAKGLKPAVALGARSRDMLLYVDQLRKMLGERLRIATDDGTMGIKGYVSDYAGELMKRGGHDIVYTCGPELMMAKVFHAAEENGLPVQASLERYVKCAAGLCGSCAIGPYRVCKDGPVFDTAMLREVRDEFGALKMDASGRVVRVDH